jgi:hypothetical protein
MPDPATKSFTVSWVQASALLRASRGQRAVERSMQMLGVEEGP